MRLNLLKSACYCEEESWGGKLEALHFVKLRCELDIKT